MILRLQECLHSTAQGRLTNVTIHGKRAHSTHEKISRVFMHTGCLGRALPNDAIGFSVACSVHELCVKLCGDVGENGMRIFASEDQLPVRNRRFRIRLYEWRAQFRRSELTFKHMHMEFGTVDSFLFYWCLGGQDGCGQLRS